MIGAKLIFPGGALKANDTALATINRVSPLYITFSIPEKYLPKVRSAMSKGGAGCKQGGCLKVSVPLPGNTKQRLEGVVRFIDNAVDPATGTIQIKALLDNKDETLTPGQYLNLSLNLDTLPNAVVVPNEAVQQGVDGTFIFVVDAQGAAEVRASRGCLKHWRSNGDFQRHPAWRNRCHRRATPAGSRRQGGGKNSGIATRHGGQSSAKQIGIPTMQLPELCIRRPVMTTLLIAAFVIFGIIAYRALPVSELPSVDFPTISVSASLPGASPETMAAAVATPLEGQFSTIAGLDSMTSTSAQGSTSITLQFSLARDIDAAAQDVQSAISAALRKLPPNMPAPPSFRKVNPADSPIFYVALSSPTLPFARSG